MSYPITTLKDRTEREIVVEVSGRETLRAKTRAMIYHGMIAIEQAQQQRTLLSIVEVRRMELQLAQNVIDFLKKELT